jgi:Uma2 family endonuclease
MTPVLNLSDLDLNNGVYSYADYLTWKFEQTVELVKGKILPMAAPSRKHQAISRDLNGIFYNHFKNHRCEFYAAPFDVRLLNKEKSEMANKEVYTVVQPDICIICDLEKLDDRGCLGAPDLVIEILSPGNSSKEMKLKKALYEENQIREYWIIDPEHENAFQFHLTEAGVYSHATIYVSDDILECVIFPDLKIDLQDIFVN